MASHDPAELPTTPCSVVWHDGHPWVLDGEPGVGHPEKRWWVGRRHASGEPVAMTRSEMIDRGFAVVYVDPGDADEDRLVAFLADEEPLR